MKNYLATLVLIGLVNLSYTQDYIAMETSKVDVNTNIISKKTKKATIENSVFISAFENEELPKIVKNMHKQVAQFELKTLDIYTPNEKALYEVTFDEGDYKIVAQYNHDGKLTQSTESYKNIRVPYSVSSKLAKEYPGWAYSNTLCKIIYNNSELPKITYHIVLDKNGEKKTVKVTIA